METTIKGSYKNVGKTVTDATGDLSLRITVADIDAAVCRSPHECVIAQAIMRQTRAPWVEVRNDVIYVGTSETEGVRYLHTTMSKEQVRQKLGTPGDVSDRQDFFNITGNESAQVFYDATARVMAVSVNYLGEGSGAPAPEKIFGVPVQPAADGTIYKLVRYERAGYFVVYSRTGGDAPPLVTVTMQKIINCTPAA